MSLEVLLNERKNLICRAHAIDNEVWELLKKYRTKLSKRTYAILKARLYQGKTLQEVAMEWDMTTERIRLLANEGMIQIDNLIAETK